MSMQSCKWCQYIHDTDYYAEHQDECEEKPQSIKQWLKKQIKKGVIKEWHQINEKEFKITF